MTFESWLVWHLSEVQRRLREFMAERGRRGLAKEKQARFARLYDSASDTEWP